ncbi:MAG: metallophosphoesterase [Desulfotalea sp.]
MNPSEELLFYTSSFTYLFLGYISFWLVAWGCYKISIFAYRKFGENKGDIGSGRRNFLQQAGLTSLLLVPAIPVMKGVSQAFSLPEIVFLNIKKTPFRKLRIVQLSDLHIGSILDGEWLKKIVLEVNTLKPDIVVITGDLVDGSVSSLSLDVACLADLKARHGIYMVTGNHEFYSDVEEWLPHFKHLGINCLNNEHNLINHDGKILLLAGMWDYAAGRRFGSKYQQDSKQSLAGADDFDYALMLAHQPNAIHETAKVGCFDLQLSGHTHSGQFWPFTEVVKLFQTYRAGYYNLRPTKLYVNAGTGFWGPPIRIGSKNEITVFDLS